MFVNLVAMRSCMSSTLNPGALLTERNLSVLQRANVLFHAAHNGVSDHTGQYTWFLLQCVVRMYLQCVFPCLHNRSALAREAIDGDRMLWKVRPKYHQSLDLSACIAGCFLCVCAIAFY